MPRQTKAEILKLKTNLRFSFFLAAILISVTIIAGLKLNPGCFWAATLLVPLGLATAVWRLKSGKLKELLELRERWAKRQKKSRDFTLIGWLYHHLAQREESAATIDEQTWRDLNGNALYALLDRSLTSPGEAVLYKILRNPCLDKEPLLKRAKIVEAFQDDQALREELQLGLLPLKRAGKSNLAALLWRQPVLPPPYAFVFTILAFLALASLFTPLFMGKYSIFMITGMLGLNSLVHYQLNKKYEHTLPALAELAVLIKTASKIALISHPALDEHAKKLLYAYQACRPIYKKTAYLQPPKLFTTETDFIYDYFKLFFLLEVRAFYGVLKGLKLQAAHLQKIYLSAGELDALQSVASYQAGLDPESYTRPKLVKEGAAYLKVTEIYHPLLEDAVANSIDLAGQGVLITGSNMSGKSTFLRTIGVNALLAQTIFITLAASYEASFFRLITSINRQDNLLEGKSFYYQEAQRLLKVIRAASATEVDSAALCLIDELLSGTNYAERLASSQAILNYLAKQNAKVMVATHDLDLAERLKEYYHCYHFADAVDEEGLKFDFKLKSGVAYSRNAVKLLDYLNYPEEITRQARLLSGQ